MIKQITLWSFSFVLWITEEPIEMYKRGGEWRTSSPGLAHKLPWSSITTEIKHYSQVSIIFMLSPYSLWYLNLIWNRCMKRWLPLPIFICLSCAFPFHPLCSPKNRAHFWCCRNRKCSLLKNLRKCFVYLLFSLNALLSHLYSDCTSNCWYFLMSNSCASEILSFGWHW